MKKVLYILVFALLGIGSLAWLGYNWLMNDNVKTTKDQSVYVGKNASLETLLDTLNKYQVLISDSSFKRIAKAKKLENPHPGHYIISPSMSNNSMVNMFKAGFQKPVNIVINSDNYLEDIAEKLGGQLYASSDDILEEMKISFGKEASFKIIPNTYEVYWTISPADLCKRLALEAERFWNDSRLKKAKALGLTPHEVVVLASIVEKETAKPDEYNTVAGLYLNRIKKGWRLQSDPTVIYSKKEIEGRDLVIKRVLYKDLKIDSPYNTYQNYGLPPYPIYIPESKVIDAVLKGSNHTYMYMCANPEKIGYHAFATTDKQHNVNKKKYTQWLNRNKIYR